MHMNTSWESAVLCVFATFLRTDGWFISVTRGSRRHPVLSMEGGDFLSAKSAIRAVNLGNDVQTDTTLHQWHSLTIASDSGAQPKDALVFVMPAEDGYQIEGAILMPRTAFEESNFESEGALLDFLNEEVSRHANHNAANRNVMLMSKLTHALSQVFVVVDRSGRVVSASEAGMDAISRMLRAKRGDEYNMRSLLRSEIDRFEAAGAKPNNASVPTNPNKKPPYELIRLVDEGDPDLPGGPYYAVFEPKQNPFPDGKTLQANLGLTPSEANVVGRLVEGQSVDEIAETTKLSVSTVRTYLKRCYAKAGVNGQSQLIVMLSNMRGTTGL